MDTWVVKQTTQCLGGGGLPAPGLPRSLHLKNSLCSISCLSGFPQLWACFPNPTGSPQAFPPAELGHAPHSPYPSHTFWRSLELQRFPQCDTDCFREGKWSNSSLGLPEVAAILACPWGILSALKILAASGRLLCGPGMNHSNFLL